MVQMSTAFCPPTSCTDILNTNHGPFHGTTSPFITSHRVAYTRLRPSHHLQHNSFYYPCSVTPPCSSFSQPSAKLPPTTATYIDPNTGSKVHVIGCVHGSQISADDVHKVLSETNPDAVVLELCEPRLAALSKFVLRTPANEPLRLHSNDKNQTQNKNGKKTFKKQFEQMTRTFQGVPQAILALALDSAYRLQTISGLDPGIEFAYAIRNYPKNQIICGDDLAKDTIGKLYKVFISPIQSLKVAGATYISMFRRILLPPIGGVRFWIIMTEMKRLEELLKLLFTASIVGFGLFIIIACTNFVLDISSVSINSSMNFSWNWFQFLDVMIQYAISTYLIATTSHFLKVLIVDRDAVIANNIQNTIQKYQQEKQQPVTVCAVVGLLHVNGVLQALREQPPSS